MMQAILGTLTYFAVFSVITLIGVKIFTLTTKYNDWEEIAKGNLAAALVLGGKLFGVGNILHFAIMSNDSISQTCIWGGIGLVLLLFVYVGFELFTSKINVNSEIAKGNTAVGFISLILSVTFSYIIGASIF